LTEGGFATESFLWENMWTYLFKHRISSYILGYTFWGMNYVLFQKELVIQAFNPIFKTVCGVDLTKKKTSPSKLFKKHNVKNPTISEVPSAVSLSDSTTTTSKQ